MIELLVKTFQEDLALSFFLGCARFPGCFQAGRNHLRCGLGTGGPSWCRPARSGNLSDLQSCCFLEAPGPGRLAGPWTDILKLVGFIWCQSRPMVQIL